MRNVTLKQPIIKMHYIIINYSQIIIIINISNTFYKKLRVYYNYIQLGAVMIITFE